MEGDSDDHRSTLPSIDGIIDIQNIFMMNNSNKDYFISGPSLMIKSFKQTLVGKCIPTVNILTDDWE
jgi:hypothetical protein